MEYHELLAEIRQVEKKGVDTKAFYETEFDKLQDIYNKQLAKKTIYVSRVKDDVRMIKEVIALKKA
jgi:hypothetical protein